MNGIWTKIVEATKITCGGREAPKLFYTGKRREHALVALKQLRRYLYRFCHILKHNLNSAPKSKRQNRSRRQICECWEHVILSSGLRPEERAQHTQESRVRKGSKMTAAISSRCLSAMQPSCAVRTCYGHYLWDESPIFAGYLVYEEFNQRILLLEFCSSHLHRRIKMD